MLENYFQKFRKEVIGIDQKFETPYGVKKIIYADWTASGRLYRSIEERISNELGPMVGNTHTETAVTGSAMTKAYHQAMKLIKEHVHASPNDVILCSNSGMTGVINKFQRILGLRVHEKYKDCIKLSKKEKPIVFVTHMEHHSNQTSWVESLADLAIIPSCPEGMVNLDGLRELLVKYKDRKTKIAAVTSYSNVTGVGTPYHKIAEIMHEHGGLCFVDFACSAPYIDIDMHAGGNENKKLDAIYFSPHKFLGGPGSSGVLIFDRKLYDNKIPDNPGGGTVEWTNPWGGHRYVDNVEQREDGGTPAFLQTVKVALAIRLKEEMGVEQMLKREEEQFKLIWPELEKIPNLHILAGNLKDRLGVISFYIDGLHYNLAVRILNDKYGIQTRGGCSCAGTYGHMLLHVDIDTSKAITDKIDHGDLSLKPGWIRFSIHPIMTDDEIRYIIQAIKELAGNYKEWEKDYDYNVHTNEFTHKSHNDDLDKQVNEWLNNRLTED